MSKEIIEYNWEMFDKDIKTIHNYIKCLRTKILAIVAIPRGGLVLGTKLSHLLNIPLFFSLNEVSKKYKQNEICIVDDISDTGETLKILGVDNYNVITLFMKPQTNFIPNFFCKLANNNSWIVFPWENEKTEKLKCKKDN